MRLRIDWEQVTSGVVAVLIASAILYAAKKAS